MFTDFKQMQSEAKEWIGRVLYGVSGDYLALDFLNSTKIGVAPTGPLVPFCQMFPINAVFNTTNGTITSTLKQTIIANNTVLPGIRNLLVSANYANCAVLFYGQTGIVASGNLFVTFLATPPGFAATPVQKVNSGTQFKGQSNSDFTVFDTLTTIQSGTQSNINFRGILMLVRNLNWTMP